MKVNDIIRVLADKKGVTDARVTRVFVSTGREYVEFTYLKPMRTSRGISKGGTAPSDYFRKIG